MLTISSVYFWLFVFLQLCIRMWCFTDQIADGSDLLDCTYDTARGIKICDCRFRNENFVLPEMTGKVHQIHVANCHSLRIKSGTFHNMNFITHIIFSNIETILMEKYSLEFREQFPASKLRLEFQNVTFSEIDSHSIRGIIDRIEFKNCVIFNIRPFGITVADRTAFIISIVSTMIHRIESQAFKNIAIDRFEIIDSVVLADTPSRAFFDLDIRDQFLMVNSTFASLEPKAFTANRIKKFILRNNSFENIHGEGLNFEISDSINVQQNVFNYLSRRAFAGITVAKFYKSAHSEPLEWIFKSNSIIAQELPYGLIFDDDFKLSISDLNYRHSINCDEANALKNNYFLNQHANSVHFQFSTGSNLNTYSNEQITQPLSMTEILRDRCVEEPKIYMSLIAVFVALIILVIVCGFVAYRYVRERRKLNELDIVAPDGKTYRETQIVFQVQNVGLLKTDL